MKKSLIFILFLSILLIAGCANKFITKECLYRVNVDQTEPMGILCGDEGINKCINIKDNIEKFKTIPTENIMCSSTSLKKIVNSNGGFVNCNSADDCYRVLAIAKPFDDFNAIVCDDEFCKTTLNYDKELSKSIKQPEPEKIDLEIPADEPADGSDTETATTNPVIVPTGCGDNICAEDENCANCEEDCGCASSVAYCNTTKQMCVKLPTNSS